MRHSNFRRKLWAQRKKKLLPQVWMNEYADKSHSTETCEWAPMKDEDRERGHVQRVKMMMHGGPQNSSCIIIIWQAFSLSFHHLHFPFLSLFLAVFVNPFGCDKWVAEWVSECSCLTSRAFPLDSWRERSPKVSRLPPFHFVGFMKKDYTHKHTQEWRRRNKTALGLKGVSWRVKPFHHPLTKSRHISSSPIPVMGQSKKSLFLILQAQMIDWFN